jgi:hypothetical protein
MPRYIMRLEAGIEGTPVPSAPLLVGLEKLWVALHVAVLTKEVLCLKVSHYFPHISTLDEQGDINRSEARGS